MYLVYGSTEYNKEIHVVIGTNVLSVWVYRMYGSNVQNITRRYML